MPSNAVQRGPNGLYVYVVKPDNTAELRPVEAARLEQTLAVISSGIDEGERVVVSGHLQDPAGRRRQRQDRPDRAKVAGRSGDMNISAPFIRRPIATALLMVGLLLAGIAAYPFLPVAPLPQVDFPTIQVSASLPGASPETMASTVAQPLERQFAQISGVSQITSTSVLGSTQIIAAVRPGPRYRRRGAGYPDRDQRGRRPVAEESAEPADLPQGQPGGLRRS